MTVNLTLVCNYPSPLYLLPDKHHMSKFEESEGAEWWTERTDTQTYIRTTLLACWQSVTTTTKPTSNRSCRRPLTNSSAITTLPPHSPTLPHSNIHPTPSRVECDRIVSEGPHTLHLRFAVAWARRCECVQWQDCYVVAER